MKKFKRSTKITLMTLTAIGGAMSIVSPILLGLGCHDSYTTTETRVIYPGSPDSYTEQYDIKITNGKENYGKIYANGHLIQFVDHEKVTWDNWINIISEKNSKYFFSEIVPARKNVKNAQDKVSDLLSQLSNSNQTNSDISYIQNELHWAQNSLENYQESLTKLENGYSKMMGIQDNAIQSYNMYYAGIVLTPIFYVLTFITAGLLIFNKKKLDKQDTLVNTPVENNLI